MPTHPHRLLPWRQASTARGTTTWPWACPSTCAQAATAIACGAAWAAAGTAGGCVCRRGPGPVAASPCRPVPSRGRGHAHGRTCRRRRRPRDPRGRRASGWATGGGLGAGRGGPGALHGLHLAPPAGRRGRRGSRRGHGHGHGRRRPRAPQAWAAAGGGRSATVLSRSRRWAQEARRRAAASSWPPPASTQRWGARPSPIRRLDDPQAEAQAPAPAAAGTVQRVRRWRRVGRRAGAARRRRPSLDHPGRRCPVGHGVPGRRRHARCGEAGRRGCGRRTLDDRGGRGRRTRRGHCRAAGCRRRTAGGLAAAGAGPAAAAAVGGTTVPAAPPTTCETPRRRTRTPAPPAPGPPRACEVRGHASQAAAPAAGHAHRTALRMGCRWPRDRRHHDRVVRTYRRRRHHHGRHPRHRRHAGAVPRRSDQLLVEAHAACLVACRGRRLGQGGRGEERVHRQTGCHGVQRLGGRSTLHGAAMCCDHGRRRRTYLRHHPRHLGRRSGRGQHPGLHSEGAPGHELVEVGHPRRHGPHSRGARHCQCWEGDPAHAACPCRAGRGEQARGHRGERLARSFRTQQLRRQTPSHWAASSPCSPVSGPGQVDTVHETTHTDGVGEDTTATYSHARTGHHTCAQAGQAANTGTARATWRRTPPGRLP